MNGEQKLHGRETFQDKDSQNTIGTHSWGQRFLRRQLSSNGTRTTRVREGSRTEEYRWKPEVITGEQRGGGPLISQPLFVALGKLRGLLFLEGHLFMKHLSVGHSLGGRLVHRSLYGVSGWEAHLSFAFQSPLSSV